MKLKYLASWIFAIVGSIVSAWLVSGSFLAAIVIGPTQLFAAYFTFRWWMKRKGKWPPKADSNPFNYAPPSWWRKQKP